MRLDQLKDSLADLAEEVPTDESYARLSGVNDKIARARRQRQWGTAAVVVAAVLAVIAIPSVVIRGDKADRPTPPTATDEGLSTIEEKGIAFYTDAAGSKLIGHIVTDEGASTGQITVVPETLDLAWSADCYLDMPERQVDQKRLVWLDLRVNGRDLGSQSCGGRPADSAPLEAGSYFGANSSPAANERGWADLGTGVGESMTFELEIRGARDLVAEAQVAAGLYERGSYSQHSGVWLADRETWSGADYEFVGLRIADFERTPSVVTENLSEPDGGTIARIGLVDTADGRGLAVSATGGSARYELDDGASFVVRPKEGLAQMRIRIGMQRSDVSGSIYVAEYRRVS